LASGVDPRIKVLEALDPWGDWPTWMRSSPVVPEEERPEYVKPEFLKKVAVMDPVDVLPKIQAKKFRLDNELFDTAIPRAVVEKLRSVAPAGATLMAYKDINEFKAAFQDGQNLDWIKYQLESIPGPADPAGGRKPN
jgi:hypothetical protein